MSISMFLISLIYVVLVYVATKLLVEQIVQQHQEGVVKIERVYNRVLKQKKLFIEEKNQLEEEAMEIFTLYEMTKEITRNFKRDDAFEIFQNKLRENVDYEECRLLEPSSPEARKLKNAKEYFLFTLKGKRRLLGHLAIKGISEEEKEIIMILAHQFALSLRRIQLYQEVEKLATTDSLTDVYTRRYILENFEEEMKRSKSRKINLSFLMIDVDRFKRINDKYGHLAGDQILREIAAIIKENIREIDVVGRYGGEEFCAVLPDTDQNGAIFVAERIRSAVEKVSIKAYDTSVKATVSIGVATFPKDGKIMSALLDKADWALYRAKKQGRNTVCAFGVYK